MVLFSALDAFGQAGAKRGANPESSRAEEQTATLGTGSCVINLITQTRLCTSMLRQQSAYHFLRSAMLTLSLLIRPPNTYQHPHPIP